MLKITSWMLPFLLFGTVQTFGQGVLPAEELAPDLYRIESTVGSNILALRGPEFTLLVDAGPSDGVERLQATLDSLAMPPVKYVVNTHYHDDHIAGNAWFAGRGAVVMAQSAALPEAMKDTTIAEWNDWHRKAAAPDALPGVTFDNLVTMRVGNVHVRVSHAPRAHTGGDAIVAFPELGVVHTGDIYEVGAYPFVDHWAGGSIDGMIAAIDGLLDRSSAELIFVPGHGTPGGAAQLREYRNMLVSVCVAVKKGLDAGQDIREVLDTNPTAPFDDTQWGAARHGRAFAAVVVWSIQAQGTAGTCEANHG